MSKGRKIATNRELADACVRDARLPAGAESWNAAYLASQAAKHLITAVTTSADIHIERRDAHQLDTIIRTLPTDNPDRDVLMSIDVLEPYAIGIATGRRPGVCR